MGNIILDVDGTLWDSTEQVAVSWNETIKSFPHIKKVITGKELKGLFGKSTYDIFKNLFPTLGDDMLEKVADECTLKENAYMNTAPCYVFDGVEECIPKLDEIHNLYIVSNCMSGYIDAFLHNTKLAPYIKGHLCFGDTGLSKGENLLQLMHHHHLEHAIYVGDTMGDYIASQKANIPFIFAQYGFGTVNEAKYSIASFCELLDLDYDTLQTQNIG